MRFPGRIYQGKKGRYLAIYSHHSDICIKAPQSIEENSERLAHVKYSEGGKRKGINVFSLQKESELPEINLAKPIDPIRENINEKIDNEQDIQYELIKGIPTEVINLIRKDIFLYCRRKVKNPQEENRIKYSDKIVPETSLRKINPERILTPGKQDFVPSCNLEANIDFSKGCISGWRPENGASFNGQTFTNFFLAPWSECAYCYAQPKHKSFPKTVYNIEKERLKQELLGDCRLTVGSNDNLGRPVKVLRFGKRTEAASEYTLDSLALTLETCIETGTRTVLPTKFLRFNPEIADLLKRTNSVVLYSIGFDELEKGACSHGCNNKWRTEQAIKYKQAGANTILYLLILAHAPITERERKLIEKARKHDIPIQLLPMRFSSKELTHKVTGVTWHDLKQAPGKALFADMPSDSWGTYEQESGMITTKKVHKNWLNLIQDNSETIRMCHHTSHLTWCGACYLQKGLVIETSKRNLESFGGRFKKKARGQRLPFSE